MATEDFSFPTFTDKFSCSIDSPPLWHLSPVASPDSRHQKPLKESTREESGDQEQEYGYCFETEKPIQGTRRKSFSCAGKGSQFVKRTDHGENDDKEEKMDMLWEDFNEELTRSYSSRLDADGMVDMGCIQALRLSKTSDAVFSPRRPGLVVFMKVLKRVFLPHNSHRSVKNHSSHRPVKKHTL